MGFGLKSRLCLPPTACERRACARGATGEGGVGGLAAIESAGPAVADGEADLAWAGNEGCSTRARRGAGVEAIGRGHVGS